MCIYLLSLVFQWFNLLHPAILRVFLLLHPPQASAFAAIAASLGPWFLGFRRLVRKSKEGWLLGLYQWIYMWSLIRLTPATFIIHIIRYMWSLRVPDPKPTVSEVHKPHCLVCLVEGVNNPKTQRSGFTSWGLPLGALWPYGTSVMPWNWVCVGAITGYGLMVDDGWWVDGGLHRLKPIGKAYTIAGWCFGTWILWLSIDWNVIIPTDELIFCRGVGGSTTNQIIMEFTW